MTPGIQKKNFPLFFVIWESVCCLPWTGLGFIYLTTEQLHTALVNNGSLPTPYRVTDKAPAIGIVSRQSWIIWSFMPYQKKSKVKETWLILGLLVPSACIQTKMIQQNCVAWISKSRQRKFQTNTCFVIKPADICCVRVELHREWTASSQLSDLELDYCFYSELERETYPHVFIRELWLHRKWEQDMAQEL